MSRKKHAPSSPREGNIHCVGGLRRNRQRANRPGTHYSMCLWYCICKHKRNNPILAGKDLSQLGLNIVMRSPSLSFSSFFFWLISGCNFGKILYKLCLNIYGIDQSAHVSKVVHIYIYIPATIMVIKHYDYEHMHYMTPDEDL